MNKQMIVTLVAGMVFPGVALAFDVGYIVVTKGKFGSTLSALSGSCTDPDAANFGSDCINAAIGANNLIVAGQRGEHRTNFSPRLQENILNFNFFGTAPSNRINVNLHPSAIGASDAKDWENGFTGSVDMGGDGVLSVGDIVTLNLGGWYMNWGASNSLQGTDTSTNQGRTSASATGSITSVLNPREAGFTVSWLSFIDSGPFSGSSFAWEISGVLGPVPEPETWAMLLAGLGLVSGAAYRRRKITNVA